jgi:hypothetical protein
MFGSYLPNDLIFTQAKKLDCMHTLFVKVNGKYRAIAIADITHVEGLKNYVRIHTIKKVFVAHSTLKQIEEHLPSQHFSRIHKSFIVSLEKITEFSHDSITLGTIELPMTAQHYNTLKCKLNIVCNEKNTNPAIIRSLFFVSLPKISFLKTCTLIFVWHPILFVWCKFLLLSLILF